MSLAVIEQDAAPPSFLRERLRDAILDRDTKSARQAEAASALSRCDEMLAEKEQRLATEFGDLDDVLAQHMAVALKNDSEPDPAVAEQMTAMRAARDLLRENIAAARAAREILVKQLADAETTHAAADRAARLAALAIVTENAEDLAKRLSILRHQLFRMSYALRGYSKLWVPTGQNGGAPLRPITLSKTMIEAMDMTEPQFPPLHSPEAKYFRARQQLWADLQNGLVAEWQEDN